MSVNQPTGKSSQTFYFQHPYEAKHAIGKQHTKRLDFESREGIATVLSLCDYRGSPGRFVINGKPHAVDALMVEISEWLRTCQQMHVRNMFL